jgi:hypothetical protein
MLQAFKKHTGALRDWLMQQENIEILYVSYNDIINNPRSNAQTVNEFLGKSLDIEKMEAVIDESLYRNRTTSERSN